MTSNNQEEKVTLGVTSAISDAYPKPKDLILTKELSDALEALNYNESPEELQHRVDVLSQLNILVSDWVVDVSLKKFPESIARIMKGKVFTFGSYRLGVHSRGADIDTLCVVPRHVDRSDFFSSFKAILEQHDKVTNLMAVEDAFVPVLKMEFDTIEIDLLFARLALQNVPPDLELSGNEILRNIDLKCIRSLNGSRVTDRILQLVPNVETFRAATRAIKVWAKARLIYNNKIGFLGGVSWAMLVARTCQLYPNAAPSTIVGKMFNWLLQWDWPRPVMLDVICSQEESPLDLQVWDSRYHVQDSFHIMPILTPAHPHQNSTFNVTRSNFTIMMKEVERGLEVMGKIEDGAASFSDFWAKKDFFSLYKHYISVTATSDCWSDQIKWSGYVESKVRLLIQSLERNPHISMAHVNPVGYKPQHIAAGKEGSIWLIGITFKKSEKNDKNESKVNIDLTYEAQTFTQSVSMQACNSNLWVQGMHIETKYIRRKNLGDYLPADSYSVESHRKKKKKGSQSSGETPFSGSQSSVIQSSGETTFSGSQSSVIQSSGETPFSSQSMSIDEATPPSTQPAAVAEKLKEEPLSSSGEQSSLPAVTPVKRKAQEDNGDSAVTPSKLPRLSPPEEGNEEKTTNSPDA